METTTGMSAPPMGMMISTPIANASNVSSQNAACDSVRQNHTTSTTIDTPRAALRRCCPGNTTGRPETSPCSLVNATTEPVNVTAPTPAPMDISMRLAALMAPTVPIPYASGVYRAAAATRTAASPTRLWNAATSCGIAVIGIRRAMTAPAPPPIPTPSTIRPHVRPSAMSASTRVVTTAMAMPTIPRRLPRREVSGEESPRSARMKSAPDTR